MYVNLFIVLVLYSYFRAILEDRSRALLTHTALPDPLPVLKLRDLDSAPQTEENTECGFQFSVQFSMNLDTALGGYGDNSWCQNDQWRPVSQIVVAALKRW